MKGITIEYIVWLYFRLKSSTVLKSWIHIFEGYIVGRRTLICVLPLSESNSSGIWVLKMRVSCSLSKERNCWYLVHALITSSAESV